MRLEAFVVMHARTFDRERATRLLQDHVKHKLLPHKYPRVIRFLSELPKTGTGKIDRQALLQSVAADVPPNEAADPVPSHRLGSVDSSPNPDVPSSRQRNVMKLADRRHLRSARSDMAAG
jgi:hypothetical protein